MLNASEAKEKQAQFRSEEELSVQYLNVIENNINIAVQFSDRNSVDYYGPVNELTKTKLIENGFKIEPCQQSRYSSRVEIGIKISW